MNLNNIIVHKLDKQAQVNASLELRENLLPDGDKETEFVTNLELYFRHIANELTVSCSRSNREATFSR